MRYQKESFLLIEVKDIKDLVKAYVDRTISAEGNYHRKWPVIAGPYLRTVTSFAKMDGSIICIYAKGSSARTRVMLEKRRIISDFNKEFPSANADDLKIIRMI